MKQVGIIGSGIVAQTLGKGFLTLGYPVMLGSREASKLEGWQEAAGTSALIGTFREAAQFGELLVLSVKGSKAIDALHIAGTENLAGKIVIDTTNPLADQPPVEGVLEFFTESNLSLMEQLQDCFLQARFVKAFNSVGNARMFHPQYSGRKPSMFICGNDEAARQEVSHILNQFGWEVEDMGKAAAARAIEPLCRLWCIPGFLHGEWTHAFSLLH
ncbi:MAG: NAD(P)-binding domain-containing protein [Bacteroidetes bacterium]|nr:NAD(P)-binding domain-containing protein [Bacteroidota bacterium]MBS1630146.1 NAD(P)-binding domain-containing protein [Bacteroidota bacterium]